MADIALLAGSEDLAATQTKINEVITALNAVVTSNGLKADDADLTTLSDAVDALTTTVGNNKTSVEDRVLVLEKHEGVYQEDHTPAAAPELPSEGFQIDGDENTYLFTAPNFRHKGILYSASDIIDDVEGNTTLLEELVAAQYDGETFVPGLLEIDA